MDKLSLIVIAYNMAREVPRTLRSLSPAMQRDMAAGDYEVIVLDNGSKEPLDEEACRAQCPNMRLIRVEDATRSPVPAINRGLREARNNLIGVFIDGARMASPGLLSLARAAACTHERPVIGALSFHLGPDVQTRSILAGYDQRVEDELLGRSGWEQDGYRLFDISVFAHSSADGWFVLPAETNALFMRRAEWEALGGYDEGFAAGGGGLANLDTWARATELPGARVLQLLGEATFHQVHGGIATNSRVPFWQEFHGEYLRLRGRPYRRPATTPTFFGDLHKVPGHTLQQSLERYQEHRSHAR